MLDIRNQNPCSRISTSKIKTLDRVRQGVCEEVRSKREYREQSTRHRRSFDSSSNGHSNDISNNNNNNNSQSMTGNVPHNNVAPRRASDYRLWRTYTESSPIVNNDNIDNKKKINMKITNGNKLNNRSISTVSNTGGNTNSTVLPLDIGIEIGTGIDHSENSKIKSPLKIVKNTARSNSMKSCDLLGTDDEDDNPATAAATATIAPEDTPDSSSLTPLNATTDTAPVRSMATTAVPSIHGPRTTITAHTVTSIARALSASNRRPVSTGRRPQSANATRTMSGLRRDETYGRPNENGPLASTGTEEFQVNLIPNTDMGTPHFETIRSRPSTPNRMRRGHQSRPSSASYRLNSYSNPSSGPSSLGNTSNLSSTWGNNSSPNSTMNGNESMSRASGAGGAIYGSARRYNSFSDIDYDRSIGRSSIFEGIAYAEKLHQQQQQQQQQQSAAVPVSVAQFPTQHVQQSVSSPKMSYYQVDFSEITAITNTQRQSRQLPSTFKQDLTSRMNLSKTYREGSRKEKDRDKDKDRELDNIKVDNDMKSTDEENIDNDLNNLIRNNNLLPRDVSQQNNQVSLFSLRNSVNVQKLMTDQDQNQNQNFDKKNTSEKSKELLSATITSHSSFNDLPSLDIKESNTIPILNKLSNSNTSQKIGKSSSLSTIPNSVICDNSSILPSSSKSDIKIFDSSFKLKSNNNIKNNNNNSNSNSNNDSNSVNTENINISRFEIDDNRNFKDYQTYLNSQKIQKDSIMITAENSKLKIRSAEDILNFNYDNHIIGAIPGGKIKLSGAVVSGTPLPRRNSTNSLPSR